MHRKLALIAFTLLTLLPGCKNSSIEGQSKESGSKGVTITTFGQSHNINPFTGKKVKTADGQSKTGKKIQLTPFVIRTDSMPPVQNVTIAAPVITSAANGSQAFKFPQTERNKWIEKGTISPKTTTFKIPWGKCVEPIVTKAAPPFFRDNALFDVRYIDVDQGLKSSYIRSLLQQSDGHFWFGMFDGGLCRYDGFQYEHYGADLDMQTVTSLLEDDKGNVWISTWSGGFYCYDGFRFRDYRYICKTDEDEVMSVRKSPKGVLVATEACKLYLIEGNQLTTLDMASYLSQNEYPLAAEIDKSGTIWYITDHRCFKITGNKIMLLSDFSSDLIHSASLESDNAIWLATVNGAFRFTKETGAHYGLETGLSEERITAVRRFRNGTLFFATMNGVEYVRGNRVNVLRTTAGLTNDIIMDIQEDASGNAWIGTNGGGVCIFRPDSFKHFTDQNGLPDHLVKIIRSEANNELWMGAYPGDLIQLEGDGFRHVGKTDLPIEYPVYALAKDKTGGLWFCQWGEGLYYVSGNRVRIYSEENGLLSSRIRSIQIDRNGNLWLATLAGVCKIEQPGSPDERILHYDEASGFINDRVMEIIAGPAGDIWIASEGGLSHFPDPSVSDVIHYTEKEGLPVSVIACLQFHKDELWIGTTGGGLGRLKGGKLTVYRESDGLSSDKIMGVAFDDLNRTWVTTSNGVSLLIPGPGNKRIIRFGKTDGLKGTDFYKSSIAIDGSKRLWMGSGKGLTCLDLSKWKLSERKPAVFLKNVQVNGRKVIGKDSHSERFERRLRTLRAAYHQNDFTFAFSAIDWSSAGRLEFSYRIKGWTDDWSEWSSNNTADFKNISPGAYTFEVRAKNKDGTISKPVQFHFEIGSPWWMTWWALVLFVLLGLGLIQLVIRWRVSRLKRRQRELEAVVEQRTEQLKEQTDRVTEKNNEILDSIAYAKRIQDAILPDAATVKRLLPKAFIVYQPKDIVAGDFYWISEQDNCTWFAVADCTGHGVPGALVSVVCNNALNKALEEQAGATPGDLLDKTRKIVIDVLTRSGQDVKDGMDISLCVWDKKQNTLRWSGANNPLWILRKGALLEWKGDKQPIGKYDHAHPFTTHEIQFKPGDLLLLFSDGFQDQFGGDKKKKLKIGGWKAVLVELETMPHDHAADFIRRWFEEWKSGEEQLDDVCLMGVYID